MNLNNITDKQREQLKQYAALLQANNVIDEDIYCRFDVKRGLRNADGTGVLAGLTRICNVHGYIVKEYERIPQKGELFYRGIEINDIINACITEDRFGYEEIVWLLLFGTLPTKNQLFSFNELLESERKLPEGFVKDILMKAPSTNAMIKLSRSILALYSYDNNPEDNSTGHLIKQALSLVSRLPGIMVSAYQVIKKQQGEDYFFHEQIPGLSFAENILSLLRKDRSYTREEALLLDRCLILHADHGGGNNSTFACRVLSSSGTDTYSALSAAVGSLKGPKHGGANIKVNEMLEMMKASIKDYTDDNEIKGYLEKLIRKEAGDKSGLIYGMGHAVYTHSDPRSDILKSSAKSLIKQKGYEEDFILLDAIERLAPEVLSTHKSNKSAVCANVDLYSGLVYRMLEIPEELFTPLFAVSRIAGWCAHRIEEVVSCKRIMRPAYRPVQEEVAYIPIDKR